MMQQATGSRNLPTAPTPAPCRQWRCSRIPRIARASTYQGGSSGGVPPGGHGRGGSGGGGGSGDDPPPPGWHRTAKQLRCAAAVVFAAATAAVAIVDASLAAQLPPHDTTEWGVSVIVPALNEAAGIAETVQALRRLEPPPLEIIVVDGGSTDGTRRAAARAGARVLSFGRRGRALQMNAGAAAARGQLLAFVHADSRPPAGLVGILRAAFRDPKTVVAGFRTNIEVPGRRLWFMSAHNTVKTWYLPLLFQPFGLVRGLRCLFGDQTICCRASDFRRVGGYDPRWRIMEDAQLCIDMHENGPAWPPPGPVAGASTGSSSSSSNSSSSRKGAKAASGSIRMSTSSVSSSSSSSGAQQGQQQSGGTDDDSPKDADAPGPFRYALQKLLSDPFPGRPRGRVLFVWDPPAVTSGRRLEAWGPVKGTVVHFVIALAWYMTRDPKKVEQLYEQMYTDLLR